MNPEPLKDEDVLLTTKEAARFLGLRPNTLEQYRVRNTGPPFVKGEGKARRGIHSGAVRYRLADLKAWRATGEWVGGAEDEPLTAEEAQRLQQSMSRHPSRGRKAQ
jgi:Helix-turn-helix domain